MMNLKKAAHTFTSKFGLINTHRPLVLTISEERQVYETLLKLILARVNSSTSLLRWSQKEENEDLKDIICQLYDINLMYAQVQREQAESSNIFSVALKEILQIEVGLDGLRKNMKEVSEKRERLQKAQSKHSNQTVGQEEIQKLIDEEDELKSEIDVKHIKGEIFKSNNFKKAMYAVCEANLLLASKTQLIFTAVKRLIDQLPDVPNNLKTCRESHNENICDDVVNELAKELHVERQTNKSNAIFHVQLPTSTKPIKSTQPISKTPDSTRKVSPLKKMMGKVGLERPLPMPPSSLQKHLNKDDIHWGAELKDFVIISNKPAPKDKPPPIPRPDNLRPRALSSGPGDTTYGSSEDSDDYVEPNEHPGKLYRSTSHPNITQATNSIGQYSEPWEHYISWQTDGGFRERSQTDVPSLKGYEKPFGYVGMRTEYEKPFAEYSEPYEPRLDHLNTNQMEEADLTNNVSQQDYVPSINDENLYSVPYDDNQPKGANCFDNNVISSDFPLYRELENEQNDSCKPHHPVVVESKSVQPKPRARLHTMEDNRKLRSCVSEDYGGGLTKKLIPPKPKPRPKSKFGDHQRENEEMKHMKDLTIELKEKMRPTEVIPSLTTSVLKQSGDNEYTNDFQFNPL